MSLPIPTEIVVRFAAHDDTHATLSIKHETHFRHLSILHEQINAAVSSHDAKGVSITGRIEVCAGETLTFIARLQGDIVGTLVTEVEPEADMLGYILAPKGGYGILLHQEGVLRVEELHQVEEEVQSC